MPKPQAIPNLKLNITYKTILTSPNTSAEATSSVLVITLDIH